VFVCVAPKLQVLVPSVPEKIHVLVAAIVPDLFFKKTKKTKKIQNPCTGRSNCP
jgi:hypothetical protein